MGLVVHWTDFAKGELKNIFDYHKEKASLKIARQIVKEIVEKAEILSYSPLIGTTEELLKDRHQGF